MKFARVLPRNERNRFIKNENNIFMDLQYVPKHLSIKTRIM